ncbi:MAG: aspartyl protease family protein [Candidatus Binatia bacterium]
MGTFTVRVALPDGSDIEALVDTGATFSKLPSGVLRRLGVPSDFETTVELGDGRLIRRKVGYVRLGLGRRRAPVPVMFGGSREEPLVGATTLEILGFRPDPVRLRLVEARHLEISERRAPRR